MHYIRQAVIFVSMKGENSLYKSIVPSSLANLESGVKSQRNTFLEQRSDAMACRYYYHATICRLRYDDCLLNLSAEFFLAPETIIEWLKQRMAFVNRLVDNQIKTSELRQKYPFYDWSGRVNIPT